MPKELITEARKALPLFLVIMSSAIVIIGALLLVPLLGADPATALTLKITLASIFAMFAVWFLIAWSSVEAAYSLLKRPENPSVTRRVAAGVGLSAACLPLLDVLGKPVLAAVEGQQVMVGLSHTLLTLIACAAFAGLMGLLVSQPLRRKPAA